MLDQSWEARFGERFKQNNDRLALASRVQAAGCEAANVK
jgi:hypothetical protein